MEKQHKWMSPTFIILIFIGFMRIGLSNATEDTGFSGFLFVLFIGLGIYFWKATKKQLTKNQIIGLATILFFFDLISLHLKK